MSQVLALAAAEGAVRVARVLDGALWKSTGAGAALLACQPDEKLAGATRFELELIDLGSGRVEPELRFDYGEGFGEGEPVVLASRGPHGTRAATVELDRPPRRIRVEAGRGARYFFCSALRVSTAGAATMRIGAVLHLSRADLWPEMAQYLLSIRSLERLYVCFPEGLDTAVENDIVTRFPQAVTCALAADEPGDAASQRLARLAAREGLALLCFLNTRPHAHVGGGDAGRWDMAHKLVGSAAIVDEIVASFRRDATLEVVAPAGHVLPSGDRDFVAGAMFWARLSALAAGKTPRIAETPANDPATRTAFDFAPAPAGDPEALTLGSPAEARLAPLAGLARVDAVNGEWDALHNDPQFAIEGLGAHAGRWVLVRAKLLAPFSSHQPAVHFDFGAGWTAQQACGLARPRAEDGITETVCLLPQDFVAARLDPTGHPGRFALRDFEVRTLTLARAVALMRAALAKHEPGEIPTALEHLRPAYQSLIARFDFSYANWIRRYETPPDAFAELARAQARWRDRPTVSLVAHVPSADLPALIDSLRAQVYPNWELWIAPTEAGADEARVHVLGMPDASLVASVNECLRRARGELFAVLDRPALLHPLALHHVVEAALANPQCALVFTDEDRIGVDGTRRDPWFKCELNPELLLAHDMVSVLACYRTARVREAGGLREGFEGAELYDLALRTVGYGETSAAAHVPRVLCHVRRDRRADGGDAARRADGGDAARRAVAEHLRRAGVAAEVLPAPGAPPAMQRVRFALPSRVARAAIVIPTRDCADLLRACVESVLASTRYPDFFIVVVDNGSREEATAKLLESYGRRGIRVIRDDSEFNYSALNNRAIATTDAELVCLLNNDVEVITPAWLEEMAALAHQRGVGAVGARLWYPDRRLQHAGLIMGIGGIAGYSHKLLPAGERGYACRAILHQAFSAVTAACMVVRRAVYDEVGGLDESLPVAFNDVDFCLRLREAGYRNAWTPYAELIHRESSTRGPDSTPAKARRFQHDVDFMRERWGLRLFDDPAYSPNLTLDAEDFSLAWPPRPHLISERR